MRLIRTGRDELTLVRQRSGKGFCYRQADGALITDAATRARIKALGIPPAWRDVRIAPNPRAHIQALGVDDAGREQYIYHAEWELRREGKKQRRLAALTAALPRLRRQIEAALAADKRAIDSLNR